MVSLSCRISPLTLTVIFFDRSPPAIAVATSAMFRTCAVRLPAIELTLSVKSFHVPAPPFRANFACDPRHLGSESVELVDHGVDRVFEFEDLPAHIDSDLTRQIASRDSGGDLGDVANLVGQIAAHRVDAVRQILPRPGDSRHKRLPAELSLGSDLASHSGHFGGKGAELVNHRVDGFLELKNLASDVDSDLLREVAVRNRNGDFGDIANLAGQVARHRVDAFGEIPSNPGHFANLRLTAELSVSANFASDARDL